MSLPSRFVCKSIDNAECSGVRMPNGKPGNGSRFCIHQRQCAAQELIHLFFFARFRFKIHIQSKFLHGSPLPHWMQHEYLSTEAIARLCETQVPATQRLGGKYVEHAHFEKGIRASFL